MSEAANQIFKKAKERVYRIAPLTASKASSAQRKKTTTIGTNKILILMEDELKLTNIFFFFPLVLPAEVFLKEATARYGLTSTLEASAGKQTPILLR